MLEDLMEAAGKVGLDISWGKTTLLNNIPPEDRRGMPSCELHVRLWNYTARFSTALNFKRLHDAELENLINQGWSKFHAHKQEICGRYYSLQDRLRMFEAVVTPTL